MLKKLFILPACMIILHSQGLTQNVGIGNTNPSFLLDVSSQVRIRSKDAVSTAGIYFNKIDNTGLQAYVGMQSDNYVGLFGVPLNAWGMVMHTTSGNVGIGNLNPQYLLDVSGRMRLRSLGGFNTPGIYLNKADNTTPQAFIGMQSDSYVGMFGVPLNNWGLLMNTSSGFVGIGNNQTPQSPLHVVKGVKTNGPLLSTSALILDGSQGGWLQFSNNDNIEAGILSANQQTVIRSGIVFGTDSSVQIRAGGNFTRLTIDKLGNLTSGGNASISGSATITGGANISGGASITGNANISGSAFVTSNATITGEVRRPSTGSANLVPIAYGSVSLIGVIHSGTGNFTITWLGGGRYQLNITGETLNTTNFIFMVTPVGGSVGPPTVGIANGELTIVMQTLTGGFMDNDFHFVVYKP
ncbi:hypothetical protein BH10BAC3_BH10BAC3_28510 [soil metagenome]